MLPLIEEPLTLLLCALLVPLLVEARVQLHLRLVERRIAAELRAGKGRPSGHFS